MDLLIRPEALCFRSGGEDAKAEIVRVRNVGSMLLVDARMQHSDAVLRGHWGDARRPDAGDMVNASLVPEKVFVFPRKTP